MRKRLKEVDVLLVGFGWAGGILAKELSESGLSVVALERGPGRAAVPPVSGHAQHDELLHAVRHQFMHNSADDAVTVRNAAHERALPMRRLGSFVPGTGVGGAGVQWSGQTWRWGDDEFRIRSLYEERYGKGFIPADMTLQDWGIRYDELEPCYDRFERVAGVSGRAGNLQGQLQLGGNPFESPRSRDYPLPPLQSGLAGELFAATARELGYAPFPRPTANASQPYVNPDGAHLAACQYCGFCDFFECGFKAKGSPHVTVIPQAIRQPSFTLRTSSWVTQVLKDEAAGRVTGVVYTDLATSEEFEQPAGIVVLCAYALNNVHLMLLSGIGKPYDPVSETGVVGRNYCYQTGARGWLFYEDRHFNPFMAAGGMGVVIDDFNGNRGFDRGPLSYVGGFTVGAGHATGHPIGYRPVPDGTPRWGTAWKRETARWYGHSMRLSATGSVMPSRWNHLDLDATYRNRLGLPLMRLTFDYRDNEHRISRHGAKVVNDIAQAMQPSAFSPAVARTAPWSSVPYQTTHNAGGTIMGTNPANSVVNKFCQSWDFHNLFVVGASVFAHSAAYNPTGLVGALAYWTADAIRLRYLKQQAALVSP